MDNQSERFSVKKRIESFKYAFKGIFYLLKTQHNAWIHTFAFIVVTGLSIFLKINLYEWCLVAFAIGFVFASEAFNTAIEKLVDLVSPEFNKKAGIIKDVAAGAVLISAFTAIAIGLLIFLPKIIELFK